MNPQKRKYLARIRSDSAYPAFRVIVNVVNLLLYALGGIAFAGAIVFGFGLGRADSNPPMLFVGMAMGIFYVVLGKVFREVSLMLADVADSITDLNSRYETDV
jgi:hypothetical protein